MIKLFISTEIIFVAIFYGLTVLFTNLYGLEGVTIAHAINYAIYWVVMGLFIGKTILGKPVESHAE